MAAEQEYRELLRKAQNCAECVEYFLAAIRKTPQSQQPELLSLVESAETHAKTLENELDRIWDLFKRTTA